jgi:zinc protease
LAIFAACLNSINMYKKSSGLFVCALLAISNTVFAQDLSMKLPLDSTIRTGKLANGLTYYIRKNSKPEKKVEMRLVENGGSILEDDDQQGLAHLNEHMAFNGSTHFAKNELIDFLQKMGVQFGADLNAYTGFDETVYILPIPLSDPNNLRKGLTVLQDWAGGLSFDNSQVDGERDVVLEESRLGKGADDRMFRKLYPAQYEGSRYALRLPIGKDSIVKYSSYDAIKRFYHTWYRPDLQAVIIVGDVDVDETEKLVKEFFGTLKNPVNEKERFYATVQPRQKSKAMVITDKEATYYTVQINYPFTKREWEITLSDYRKDIIKNIFTSLFNQRLSNLVKSAAPPFVYGEINYESEARNYEGFSAFAVAGQSGPDSALTALINEIERVSKYGFTEAELERAKKEQMAAMEQAYNNRTKQESNQYADEYIRLFLNHEPSPGIINEYNYYKQLLPGITLSEVNELAAPLKQNENILVSMEGPSQGNIHLPDTSTLLAEAQTALHADVKPYEEKSVASQLMKVKPQPGKIISENKNELLGVTELTFSNGAKVILKPTTFKDDEIIMTSFHKGGQSIYTATDKANFTFAANVIQQMGIGDFSPSDLEKYLAGKTTSVKPAINKLDAGISGQSSVKDFETMLQLTNLYLTSPRKDDALFTAWKEKQKSATQFAMADPETAFIDTFVKVRYQNNPLAPIAVPKPSDFDNTNIDRVLDIYKQQFGDAQDFTFIFTGNIDIEKIKPLLAIYIGSLPSTGKPAAFVDNKLRPANGNKLLTYKNGSAPKSLVVNLYSGEVPYSEDLNLKAEALTEILNIKIDEDIREKMSAIYSGEIYGSLSKYPFNNYSFVMELPCGPEHVDTVLKAAAAEIDSIKTFGPSQINLDKVKKTWIEQHKTQITENTYWSEKLQSIYFNSDDAERIFNYEKLVNALTIDDIKATANLLFDGKNILQAVLLPEK